MACVARLGATRTVYVCGAALLTTPLLLQGCGSTRGDEAHDAGGGTDSADGASPVRLGEASVEAAVGDTGSLALDGSPAALTDAGLPATCDDCSMVYGPCGPFNPCGCCTGHGLVCTGNGQCIIALP